ncbi:MAG: pyridoxamine 5'-phosphate oxidase family protein, partial [Actinomycetota bacterium]|nr:pyridoxamine 5'-phosphate oxidase family protein [Actinomycetota bacterium]
MVRADVRALVEDAEGAHVAIETGRGPHVTPELFCWNGGRLWFATARRTLKARKTRAGAPVGVFIEHGPRGL